MSDYLNDYTIGKTDADFRGRIMACIAEQAQVFINDTRAEFYMVARDAIASIETTTDQFALLVTTRPGMTVNSTDGDILTAVQYVWPIVGARYTAPPYVWPTA